MLARRPTLKHSPRPSTPNNINTTNTQTTNPQQLNTQCTHQKHKKAYIISGNLRIRHALVYGAVNLIVAPVGMAAFRRAALPSSALLALSLAMGMVSMAAFAALELAPSLVYLRRRLEGGAALRPLEDSFSLARFCRAHDIFPH